MPSRSFPATLALTLAASTAYAQSTQQPPPPPTFCTAQDASFIGAFHGYSVLAALATALLAFYLIPRLLHFRKWWLTRPNARLLTALPLFVLSTVVLLLPWMEAALGLGLGISTLNLFQVEPAYLDCRGITYSHEAALWGDLFGNNAADPAIYLVAAQLTTILLTFLIAAILIAIAHYALVARTPINKPRQLGATR